MKIYNITKVASQSEIKPELKTVFVKHTDLGITYVATDSFRLIEVKIEDENIKSIIPEGFYDLKEWATFAKETQKKKPDADFMLNISPMQNKEYWYYPEYKQIFPKEVEKQDTSITSCDIHLVSESFKIIQKITGQNWFNLTRQLQQPKNAHNGSKMMYLNTWSDDGKSEITFVLMPLNN